MVASARSFARVFDAVADWTVARVSPKRALVRRFRRALAEEPEAMRVLQAFMRTRGYAGAATARSGTAWLGGDRTADAELLNDLPTLRNRSRELLRDDSLAKGLHHTFITQCIGTGIRPQANTGDLEKDKRIEAVFRSLRNGLYPADRLPYFDAQRLRFGKHFEDGEIFRVESKRSATPELPLFFELCEADRCDTPPGWQPGTVGWSVRKGIVRDELGIPRVYIFRKRSQGDILDPLALKDMNNYFFVSASRVTHLRIVDRPGQTRGAPRLHAVLQDLRDLDLLTVASLKRMQIAACLALFIKSKMDLGEIFQGVPNGEGLKEGFKLDQAIEPGMMWKLAEGEDVSTLLPNFPVPELAPFVVSIARRIGAALGVSWQVVLKDFSDSTYSSARTDLLEARRTYRILQDWFVENDLQPEWEAVLNDALLRGDVRLRGCTAEDFTKVVWIAMGWQWIDPQKEAGATEIELRNNINTLQKVCAARGDDWREVLDQRLTEEAYEAERRKKLGIEKPAAQPADDAKKQLADAKREIADLVERLDELEARAA